MEWPDSIVIRLPTRPALCALTMSENGKTHRRLLNENVWFLVWQKLLTIGSLDQLQLLGVILCEPLYELDLFQSQLDGVLMLRTAGGVSYPKLE